MVPCTANSLLFLLLLFLVGIQYTLHGYFTNDLAFAIVCCVTLLERTSSMCVFRVRSSSLCDCLPFCTTLHSNATLVRFETVLLINVLHSCHRPYRVAGAIASPCIQNDAGNAISNASSASRPNTKLNIFVLLH